MNRFKKISKDPRFVRPKKKQTKVKIDSRFSGMINNPDFEQVSVVDSRGRSRDVATTKTVDLEKFYDFDKEDEDENLQSVSDIEQNLVKEARPSEDEDEMNEMAKIARGEIVLSDSDSDLDDEDDTGLKDGIIKLGGDSAEYIDMSEEEFEDILQTENVPIGDESRRFAVVNMDWDQITANDLFKLFEGFKPQGGFIKSVTIYPSEFGKEMMENEEREGPPKEIFADKKAEIEKDEEDDKLFKDDEYEEFNEEALRKYQLDRLRYFFAVVECDSVETASHIFRECDGTEYERSSVSIDLRFIPDEMEFGEEYKEQVTEVSTDYVPRNFTSHVLQHSKPKLTWDEDDPVRVEMTQKTFTKDDLKNLDFDAYLASEHDSDDDENEETLKEKYRALLAEINNEDGDSVNGEMEVTFAPGLSSLANDLLEKKKEKDVAKDETVFETERRLQRERKKDRRKQKQQQEETLESDEYHSDIANDPFFKHELSKRGDEKVGKKKSKKNGGERNEENEREKAELELLLMDDENNTLNSGKKHFDYEDIVKREKKAGKKSKKELVDEDDFEINENDQRFEALFTSPQFAIDPSSSKFKKTKAMTKLLHARSKRKFDKISDDEAIDSVKQLANRLKSKRKNIVKISQ